MFYVAWPLELFPFLKTDLFQIFWANLIHYLRADGFYSFVKTNWYIDDIVTGCGP